jgi:hypothetical protein
VQQVSGTTVAGLLAALLGGLFLLVRPTAPDLPAQLARASAVSRGVELWWAGWYGGINTSPYSLLSAHLMNAIGVGSLGVLSTAVICVAGADLVRTAERPRAGAIAVALVACANLYSGRITFAAGMALVLVSFCQLRRGHVTAAALAGLLSGFVSPLAALSQLTGLGALLVSQRQHRKAHVVVAVASAAPIAAVSLLFGQPSYMPFSADTCTFALLACAGVLVAPVPRQVRALALVSAVLAVGAVIVHSPVGSNAARMPMLAAAPLVVATARRGQPLGRLLAAGLVVWPAISFTSDMAIAAQPSSQAAFYAPLLTRLPASETATQRVEVLDPRTHAASYYLSQQVPLARGWERQIDAASNPLFYGGTLDAATYRSWLVQRAVGWIAVPRAHLDYSAVGERSLILSGLPYLHLEWTDPHWRLYRVTVAAPAATGVLRATALTDTSVELTASAPGTGVVRTPYSRLLVVRSRTQPDVIGCVSPSLDGSSRVDVPEAGDYVLQSAATAIGQHCSPS